MRGQSQDTILCLLFSHSLNIWLLGNLISLCLGSLGSRCAGLGRLLRRLFSVVVGFFLVVFAVDAVLGIAIFLCGGFFVLSGSGRSLAFLRRRAWMESVGGHDLDG